MNPDLREKVTRKGMSRQEGSVGELLSALLCMIAMVSVMTAFMDCVALVNKKTMVGQTARNYVLRMETVGYLTAEAERELCRELSEQGLTEVSLEGTTRVPTAYGAEITLKITGRMGGRYKIEEKRVSTAKH